MLVCRGVSVGRDAVMIKVCTEHLGVWGCKCGMGKVCKVRYGIRCISGILI